jgi:hypothetical protein
MSGATKSNSSPAARTVVGAPRRLLQLEGATLLAGALTAYTTTHEPWWLIPLTILAPDLSAIGYLAGTRAAANLYNLGHITPLPATLIAVAWSQHNALAGAIGLVWLAHIGMDRLLGYGLKYNDDFNTPTSASPVALESPIAAEP